MTDKIYCYEYPRPAVTTDCIVWTWEGDTLKVLLVERGGEPFKGKWALPGGFMEMEEDAAACARRELQEETGVTGIEVEQLYAFSAVYRDPRYRVISIAYYSIIKREDYKVQAGDDARKAEWFSVSGLPELAFDHLEILRKALQRLKEDFVLKTRAYLWMSGKYKDIESIVRFISGITV